MPFSSTDDYIFIKATARIKTDNNSTNTSLRSVIKEIKGYLFDPHQPILYKLNQKLKPHEKVAYSRQQLQVVGKEEGDVPASIVKKANTNGEFAIKTLIDKRTQGNKTQTGKYNYSSY